MGKALRSREDVERALEELGPWQLENCRYDRDKALPRYLAEHTKWGQVAAPTGPELLAAVTAVHEAAAELEEFGLELQRGNIFSPTASWWDGPVLEPGSSWANDLQDLLATHRRRQNDERWKLPKKSAATEPPPAAAADVVVGTTFADQVLAAAQRVPADGWFGNEKVFIGRIWRELSADWPSREAFDAALLEANRTQRLTLTRADLVSAMDRDDVAESEVRSFGASFHFVVVGGRHG